MDTWLGWLAVAFGLDEKGVSLWSHRRTGGEPLLTERDAAAQTRHNGFVVSDKELFVYFFIVNGEVSAYLCVPLGFRSYVHYSAAQKKLLRKPFVIKPVATPPMSALVGHG